MTTAPADGPVRRDGGVPTAVRLLGDRWSLLVVHEVGEGRGRFSELHRALPGLSRGLLAARLRYLERAGLVRRAPSSGADLRSRHIYALTPAGRALVPVITDLGSWASRWALATVDGSSEL